MLFGVVSPSAVGFLVLVEFFNGLAGGLEDGSFCWVWSSSLQARAFLYSLVGLERAKRKDF